VSNTKMYAQQSVPSCLDVHLTLYFMLFSVQLVSSFVGDFLYLLASCTYNIVINCLALCLACYVACPSLSFKHTYQ